MKSASRLLILSAGFLASVSIGRGVPSVAKWARQLRTSAIEKQSLLLHAREALAKSTLDRDSLNAVLQQIVHLGPKLLDGASPMEAQTSLSSLAWLAATRHDLKVIRMDPLQDTVSGVFGTVGLQGEFEGDIRAIVETVKALENSTTTLSVPALRVTAADPLSPPSMPEILRVELKITGVYLARSAQ